MYFKRFQQGDSVQYSGDKPGLKELSHSEGFIVGRVDGEDQSVVVTWNDNAYIMNEKTELSPYIKRAKPVDHDKKGPKVENRRGVSGEDGGRKGGGKRRKGE